MKFIIFLAGVAVGFVVGSKAGRGAYENMRTKWQGFSDSDPVRQVKGEVRDLAGKASDIVGDKVTEVVGRASEKLDEVTGKASDKLDEVTGKKADTTPTEA